MDEQHTTILSIISLIFLCISFVLYILYGKNLLDNHTLLFLLCIVSGSVAIAGLFINQIIAIVASSLLLVFICSRMALKIMNKKKLKGVGLRSYRSFTTN
jgi:hypothetical protein